MPQKGRRNADHNLLMAFACGATIESAAHSAGVSQSTAFRRLQDPEFQQRLQEVRSDMVKRAAAMLTAAAMEAVKTLLELQKPSASGPVRLGAARAVLELGIKVRETAELEERLSTLEAQLAAPKPL